ncbi:MAG: hypothetical protein IJW43_03470 [Clostridia bacterium]|nr:hypothetical protein [Clostridia bacterium]
MSFTQEKFLRDKEEKIKSLIKEGNPRFTKIVNFLHLYYRLKNLSGKAPIFYVFEAVYIKELSLPAWKLALYCNLSRTTLFNYRNEIISDFNICLTENLINEKIILHTEEKHDSK